MAFARFARDSAIDFGQSLVFGRNVDPSFFNAPIVFKCLGEWVDSLASRVNAIDPYDIFRYPKNPFTIVNIVCLKAYPSESRRAVQVRVQE